MKMPIKTQNGAKDNLPRTGWVHRGDKVTLTRFVAVYFGREDSSEARLSDARRTSPSCARQPWGDTTLAPGEASSPDAARKSKLHLLHLTHLWTSWLASTSLNRIIWSDRDMGELIVQIWSIACWCF
jgi:hypothetical protein